MTKPSKKPTETPRKGGRPTREEAAAKSVREAGVDPALVDPKRILAEIAVNASAPVGARGAAARALLAAGKRKPEPQPMPENGGALPELDDVGQRAVAIMARRNEDSIPLAGEYRGVPIHRFQTAERIAGVVRPAIDKVARLSDPLALADYVQDGSNPPEARLFAFAKITAAWEMAAEGRSNRPAVDMEELQASVAGLDSLHWIDPRNIGSLIDVPPGPGGPGKTPRAPEDTKRIESLVGR